MQTITAQDGDTWQSIAEAHSVPLSTLLDVNGVPAASASERLAANATALLPDPAPAASVAPGEDHSLDLVHGSTLWVRLDVSPDDAPNNGDSVRVYAEDGSHDVTLPIAQHFTSNGAGIDMMFDALAAESPYSLSYIRSDGTAVPLVSSASLSTLNDDALPDASAPEEDETSSSTGKDTRVFCCDCEGS